MRRAGAALSVALASLACGNASDPPPSPTVEECTSPSRIVGDRCLEPGVQDNGCAAGSLGLDDGRCLPAGVPAELCATGWRHDGDAACEPILPAESCPPGQMAVPGERACHAVMPCGTGKWGDIPVDGATVHVDASYPDGMNDGTASRPFTTISQAVAAAPTDALIAVAAGTYVEDVVITTRLRLHGVCPELVALAGTGNALGALFLRPMASGTEVRGLAITGEAAGIVVSGATDLHLDSLRVHDALDRGISIEGTLGPTAVTLEHSLIEENHDLGIFITSSEVTLDGIVIRGTLPHPVDQRSGRGIAIQADSTIAAPTSVVISGSVVEENRDVGVRIAGSQVTVEGVVVRGTLPRQSDQQAGYGIGIRGDAAAPTLALVKSSLVEESHDMGVFVVGTEATIEGVVVRRTLPQAGGTSGVGIGITNDADSGASATALIKSSLVDENQSVGVFVAGSQATLEGVSVRRTLPQAIDQHFGRGIVAHNRPSLPANVLLVGSLVEANHEIAVVAQGAQTTLDGVIVRGTLPRISDGLYGDGVAIESDVESQPMVTTTGRVVSSRIEHNARAGIASFGANVGLGASALSCNAFDLNADAYLGLASTFENLGGNACGCPTPSLDCVVQSANLAPPDAQ